MTTGNNFPQSCIKGISVQDQISQGGNAATHLYYFKDDIRQDGWMEQSINWKDDEEAINFTIAQKRDDDFPQFVYGVAILSTHELERVKNLPTVSPALSYERDALPHNPYHGNILLCGDVPKHLMKQIAANLALASEVIRTNTIHTS